MISRDEIICKSEELEVHPVNVERDYVFGWVLAGIYSASGLGKRLILKGGNCFRKAYFEAARYSPDLDFATTSRLAPEFIKTELARVCAFAQANSGVNFEIERTRVEEKPCADENKHIHEVRLYFRGFFGEESQMVISIRMDIGELERIILPVQERNLIHSYSDSAACVAQLRCLKLEETLASKLKCLLQRRHVADLFDFVNATFVSPTIEINQQEIISAFLQMTIFRPGPRVVRDLLLNLPFDIIRGFWEKYVVCPRSCVIDFDQARSRFERIVESLFGSLPPMRSELAFFPAHLRNPIMEAGYKMTTLRVVYHGVEREVEPYSLKYKIRKDGVGQEYLYVWDQTGGRSSPPGLKTFLHTGIKSIENTDNQFEPRFEVELSKAGQFFQERYFHSSPRSWVRAWSPRRQSSHAYTLECPVCGKRFYRDRYSTTLNPHKDNYGNRCLGRIGILV